MRTRGGSRAGVPDAHPPAPPQQPGGLHPQTLQEDPEPRARPLGRIGSDPGPQAELFASVRAPGRIWFWALLKCLGPVLGPRP